MNHAVYIWSAIVLMAVSTYLIRVIPLLVFRRKIRSPFIRSFLFYVPYSVLSAMTFPAVFFCTGNLYSAAAGTLMALVLGIRKKSLVLTASLAAAVALIVQLLSGLM